jgi:hypothetical protein
MRILRETIPRLESLFKCYASDDVSRIDGLFGGGDLRSGSVGSVDR